MSVSDSKAEFTRQKLNNGDTYEGYIQNGKRNGQGKYTFASGAFYEGEWKNHKQHGHGRYVSSKGWSYEGDWVNDKMHGMGRYTYADGSFYEGEFANDKFEGEGKRVFASGAVYEGGWHNDKMHGTGRYTFADGSYYEGELADGNFEGQGKRVFASGAVYEGGWHNDKMHGTGHYTYADGSWYEGELVDGKFNGSGKQVGKNGDVYEGQWKNDVRHGKGTYRWADGDTYEGDWVDGKRCGYGIFTAFGTRQPGNERFVKYSYAGEWRDSLKHGHGICIEGDRTLDQTVRVCEGEWENNRRQGRFVWYTLYADGTKSRRFIDIYQDDKAISQNLPYDGEDADEDDDAPSGPMVRGTADPSRIPDWQSARPGEHREAQKRDAARRAAVEELIDIYLHPRKFAQLSEIGDRNIEEACLFLGQYLDEAEELFLDDRTPESAGRIGEILGVTFRGDEPFITDDSTEYFNDFLSGALQFLADTIPGSVKNAGRTVVAAVNIACYVWKTDGETALFRDAARLWVEWGRDCDADYLWLQRMAENGDSSVSSFYGAEHVYSLEVDRYTMGSDCHLYDPYDPYNDL